MISNFYGEKVYRLVGMSNEVKPIKDIKNGTVYHEIDTSKDFIFDEENSVWCEWTGMPLCCYD